MELINIKSVMEQTALSKSMLYKLVKANEIPYFQFGASIRFDKNEIDNWIKNNHK